MSNDETYFGAIYDGDPEEPNPPTSIEDRQDESAPQVQSFVSPTQRNVDETLEWYRLEQTDPPFDPDGMCLKICRTARNIPARYASAKDAQDATPHEYRVHNIADIKKGMVAYFDDVADSNRFGHIVTVAGRASGEDVNSLRSLIVWTNSVVKNQLVAVRGDYFGKHWFDEFQFAATWLNGQELIFPAPSVPALAPNQKRVNITHASLEVFDTASQIESDLNKIFKRAESRNVAWITGTEAFGPKVVKPLRRIAEQFGFRVGYQPGNDAWVAVRRSFIGGGWTQHWEKIVEGSDAHRDLGVFAVEFENPDLGPITVIANHLLTKRHPDADEKNLMVTRAIGKFARVQGQGKKLVFLGSDQNMNDKTEDTFMGVPFTSIQDEKEKWENTASRPIDVIASYDPDTRVKGLFVRVLDDSEFQLFGNHNLVEAGFLVRTL